MSIRRPRHWDQASLAWLSAGGVAALYLFKLLRKQGLATFYDPGTNMWSEWFDQSRYLASATAFHHGMLDPAQHWYPLVYPLLAAPFISIAPANPFGLVDTICVVLAWIGFRQVAARFDVGLPAAFAIFAVTVLLYPRIGLLWLKPWATTPSAAFIWLAAGRLASLSGGSRPRMAVDALAGIWLALIVLARPSDLTIAAPLGLATLWTLARAKAWSSLAALSAAGFVLVAAYAALHVSIYGFHLSGYMALSAAYGIELAKLPWKASMLLIDAQPWFDEQPSLLRHMPWLIVGVAGLVASALLDAGRRPVVWALLAACAAHMATMLAYVDLLPSGLWRFNNVHYFKWMLPLLGLFAWLFVRDFRLRSRAHLAILGLLLAMTCLHVDARLAKPNEPARMVSFAPTTEGWYRIYMSRSMITDHAGVLRNILESHVFARQAELRAVALRRDFSGGETWWRQTPPGVAWPTGAGATDERPQTEAIVGRPALRRWAAVVRFGPPRWLFPRATP